MSKQPSKCGCSLCSSLGGRGFDSHLLPGLTVDKPLTRMYLCNHAV